MKTNPHADLADSKEFKEMVELLAVYSGAANRLAEIEAEVNKAHLALIEKWKKDYAELQEILTGTEAVLEAIALAHPEWFAQRKSIKTPFGTVKFHRYPKLVVKNEEATILLLQREGERHPEFKAGDFLRQVEQLDVEALEKLDDATLEQFRVVRVTENNFSVSPAKLDMGKAVKEAVEKKEAA